VWQGLVSSFYKPRWEFFFNSVTPLVQNGTVDTFNQTIFDNAIAQWETSWIYESQSFPTKPQGSTIIAAQAIYDKYANWNRDLLG
jgi:alpha-N-acetylglucosaminidase